MLNDQERGRAAQIQAQLRAHVGMTRANEHLSRQGKRAVIALATLNAKRDMAALRAESDARAAGRTADLQYRLFGFPVGDDGAGVLAARDARDRAARLTTPGEAAALLATAERAGDTSMSTAIFETAWDRLQGPDGAHWGRIADAYLQNRPKAQADAAELADLAGASRADQLGDRFTTEVPAPEEVRSGDLEALAAEAADVA